MFPARNKIIRSTHVPVNEIWNLPARWPRHKVSSQLLPVWKNYSEGPPWCECRNHESQCLLYLPVSGSEYAPIVWQSVNELISDAFWLVKRIMRASLHVICEWRTLFGCVRAEVVFADTCTPTISRGNKEFYFLCGRNWEILFGEFVLFAICSALSPAFVFVKTCSF